MPVMPKCFISYSWDSREHKKWVVGFAEQLQQNGVEVLLDQWDLKPGLDVLNYMEASIRDSDFVLLVCTPEFAEKANSGTGGTGYEKSIVTGELFYHISSPTKFVPILRRGSPEEALPSYLKSKVYVDFRGDEDFQEDMEQLLRHLHDMPRFSRPPLGPKPSFTTQRSESRLVENKGETTYCRRCGAIAGQRSVCTGLNTAHDFTNGRGTIYCRRCGVVVGERSVCTGLNIAHDFTSGSNATFCRRCGVLVGKRTECTGLSIAHDFLSP
jgi:uncharacterized C2H2 Zn-finger protein